MLTLSREVMEQTEARRWARTCSQITSSHIVDGAGMGGSGKGKGKEAEASRLGAVKARVAGARWSPGGVG